MALRFEADLELTSGGRRTTVTSDPAGALVVTTDELAPLVAALPGGAAPLGTLRQVSRRLAGAGATVHVRTPHRPLLSVGAGVAPGRLTRLAGLPHVRVESLPGVALAARPGRRPAVALGVTVAVAVVAVAGRRRR